MNSTILIHSYLYLNSKYIFSNINLTSDFRYIKDNNDNIIYGLCNIPNKKDILYDSNIYINRLVPAANLHLVKDLNQNEGKISKLEKNKNEDIIYCNIMIEFDNIKLEKKTLLKKKSYSCATLIYLIDKYINLFWINMLDQSNNDDQNNIDRHQRSKELEIINNFENIINSKNKFSHFINLDNYNFLKIVNNISCKNPNYENEIIIKGGLIVKSIYSYSYIINILSSIKKKPNLVVINSLNSGLWTTLLQKKKKLYFQIEDNCHLEKFDKFDYILIDYKIFNQNLKKIFNLFTKTCWYRIIYDYNPQFFNSKSIYSTLDLFPFQFIWFIIDKYDSDLKSFVLEKLTYYLVKTKNLRKEFNDLIRKNIVFECEQKQSIEKKNIILKFSDQESKYYNYCLSNKNNLYLRKLCCYPDNFFNLNEIILQSYTISNYIQVIDKYYQQNKPLIQDNNNNNYNNKNFSLKEVNKFGCEESNCPICLENIKQDNFGITICGHIFCYSCINSYSNCNLKDELQCPKCRTIVKSNNIFKIDKNNKLFELSEYNNHYLSNLIGTKLSFILNYCYQISQNKNVKIIIHSQYYAFIYKIHQLFNLFKFKSLFLNYINSLDYYQIINQFNNEDFQLLLLNSFNHTNNLYFEKIDYIIFCEPNFNDIDFEDKIIKMFCINKIEKIKVIKLIIDETIEKDILMKNLE